MFFQRLNLFFKSFDWSLFFIVFVLISISLAIQYSLCLDLEKNNFTYFYRQLLFAGVGMFLFFLFSFLDYRSFKTYAFPLYFIFLILLAVVLFTGTTFRGTKGWLTIGTFNFQAVEFGKIVIVVILAKFWNAKIKNGIFIREIIQSGLLVLFPFILVFFQPDFGSASILFLVWFFILIVIDRQTKHFIWIFILGLIIALSLWNFVLVDYQKNRILTYLNPQADPFGRGYQISQSMVAIGSGKLWGRGLGLGPQSQLRFLPQTRTDFTFSVVAEELGLIGVSLIMVFYLILFYRFLKLTRVAYDDFALVLIIGFASIFLIQIAINIGMNIGLVPIIGITLPLLSYGGSSLITSLVMLGILQSILLHKTR